MITISVTHEEAWILFRHVRQTDKLGLEHDWSQAQRLHAALLYFKAAPMGVYDLDIDNEFARWITRQLPDTAMSGAAMIGRSVLLKVMAALAEVGLADVPQTEPDEPVTTEVPQSVLGAFLADDAAAEEFARRYPELGKEGET